MTICSTSSRFGTKRVPPGFMGVAFLRRTRAISQQRVVPILGMTEAISLRIPHRGGVVSVNECYANHAVNDSGSSSGECKRSREAPASASITVRALSNDVASNRKRRIREMQT